MSSITDARLRKLFEQTTVFKAAHKPPSAVVGPYKFAQDQVNQATITWLLDRQVPDSILLHALAGKEESVNQVRRTAHPSDLSARAKVTMSVRPVRRGGSYNPGRAILYMPKPALNLPPDILRWLEKYHLVGALAASCSAIGWCMYLEKFDERKSSLGRQRGMTFVDLQTPAEFAQLSRLTEGTIDEARPESTMFLNLFSEQLTGTDPLPLQGAQFLSAITYYLHVLQMAQGLPSGEKHVALGGCVPPRVFQFYGYAKERNVLLARLAERLGEDWDQAPETDNTRAAKAMVASLNARLTELIDQVDRNPGAHFFSEWPWNIARKPFEPAPVNFISTA